MATRIISSTLLMNFVFLTVSNTLFSISEASRCDVVQFIEVKARWPQLVLGWVNLQGGLGTVNPSLLVGVDLKL
jgi:hypothetical protein